MDLRSGLRPSDGRGEAFPGVRALTRPGSGLRNLDLSSTSFGVEILALRCCIVGATSPIESE